ncbi:hypothetical protein ASPWEDRAFT_260999 [Aspergillus wentii DTO 134E9]|uniref:Uncharacterized protein n=1 Tax=Aspergillus wentii DTO 134E9 TaxID=1073089 RepID=A0A1L9S2F3_ASPWE|nr:uncharacterized protein ASPWEDRAFT_260999 [Aspergillus wentii DTO 134E9]OJJ41330.1 hypothetical protein ASPWEDRAFT_260999 [Aspergillus wentii DTO 134E9]
MPHPRPIRRIQKTHIHSLNVDDNLSAHFLWSSRKMQRGKKKGKKKEQRMTWMSKRAHSQCLFYLMLFEDIVCLLHASEMSIDRSALALVIFLACAYSCVFFPKLPTFCPYSIRRVTLWAWSLYTMEFKYGVVSKFAI